MRLVFLFSLAHFFFLPTAFALTVSASGEEVSYEYSTSFRTLKRGGELTTEAARAQAEFHSIHLFGLFYAPEVNEKVGIPAELMEGYAASLLPITLNIDSYRA